MAFNSIDLTGQDPLHKVINDIYRIFAPNQKIFFNTPVYADSIVIKRIGSIPNQIYTVNVDYKIQPDDIDTPTLSRVKVYDPDFNKILVRSVTITHQYIGEEYLISVDYQRLYPNQIKTAVYNSETLEWTPPLALAVLEELDRLRLMVSRVKDTSSLESDTVKYLEIDVTGTSPYNLIEDEEHYINTNQGKNYIHPIYGSFYADTLAVYNKNTNIRMTEGVDYKIVGISVSKTKNTVSSSAVYDFILFIRDFVGDVRITYQAYGGEPTLANYKDLHQQILNITNYINEAKFITETTLKNTTVVNALTDRISRLEDDMRRLLTGRPSYGDRTSGISRLYKLTASDSKLHWWNIATLYQVDGSTDIVTADRMHFRFTTLHSGIMADVYVSFNANSPKFSKLSVTVLSENYRRGYVPFTSFDDVDTITRPQFRVIWNNDTTRLSGCILQMGLELKNVVTETIAIEDFSGAECCWKLVDESDTAFTPQDDVVPLPAKNPAGEPYFIWSTSNPTSDQESTLIPFRDGHLIWAGVKTLNRPGGWNHFTLNHFLDSTVDYRRIRQMRLELKERNSYSFPIMIDFVPGSDTLTGTITTNYYNEPMHVVVNLYREPEFDDIVLEMNTYVVEQGAIPLDLTAVVIYT